MTKSPILTLSDFSKAYSCCAVVPLKDFVQAKQRLSGILNAAERRGLFHAMVQDVLGVLKNTVEIGQTIIVSDDPTASLLAEHFGFIHWSERELLETSSAVAGGLNGVVEAAAKKLAQFGVTTMAVVHGDLPLLTADELGEMINCHTTNFSAKENAHEGKITVKGVSIGTDTASDGSNVLLCSPPDLFAFAYGRGSCGLHQRAAQKINVPVEVHCLAGMSRDIDEPTDLLDLLAIISAQDIVENESSTAQYLSQNGLTARLNAIASADLDTGEKLKVLTTGQ